MSIKNRVALMTKSSQNKESIKLVRLAPYFGTFMFGALTLASTLLWLTCLQDSLELG
jgi:hypothetical protein